ncbi:hypothetical protein [Faecalibacter bovis]|uniref:Uncharacterized protein n=1 Tax=Faecalibacter bovis TaxID=2898187 RepID=A0ABX7XCN5_9FLAO|nr:hypothetical protein [Faecalibacter bovis]QTV05676.1 hypothetical protein J9309_13065 [Faecalibacter bovis]
MKSLALKYSLILTLISFQFVQAQYKITDSIFFETANISKITSNALGDIHLILNEKELIKIKKDKSIKSYPLNKIVTKIDSNLSLKTFLVYNYQELQILDDNLNPIQDRINLNKYNIFPSAISVSDSQTLWYFDPIELRLIQWNYQLKSMINKSNMLFFKEGDTTIEEIYQTKNRIFLKSQNWIYEFDFFGNSKNTILLNTHEKYCFSRDYIHLLDDNSLTTINLVNHEISTVDNFFNVKDFTMSDDQLFVIKNKGLYIYTRIN